MSKEKWQREALERLKAMPDEEFQRLAKEIKAMILGGPTITEYLIATGNEDLLNELKNESSLRKKRNCTKSIS